MLQPRTCSIYASVCWISLVRCVLILDVFVFVPSATHCSLLGHRCNFNVDSQQAQITQIVGVFWIFTWGLIKRKALKSNNMWYARSMTKQTVYRRPAIFVTSSLGIELRPCLSVCLDRRTALGLFKNTVTVQHLILVNPFSLSWHEFLMILLSPCMEISEYYLDHNMVVTLQTSHFAVQ